MPYPFAWGRPPQSLYLMLLFLAAFALTLVNLFYGFGEDSDSVRLVESALRSYEVHKILPSRSWGYPLYEALAYPIIHAFAPDLLPAKLLSVALLSGSVYIIFRTLLHLGLPLLHSFFLSLIFLCNPLIIISGNSVLETGMSLFIMLLILNYFVRSTLEKELKLLNYACYGMLFGFANLARPDNMLYFAALFLFLFSRKEFNIAGIILSAAIFFTIGIVPYYLLNYPIFQSISNGVSNNVLSVIKNFAALFGLPMLLLLGSGLVLRFSSFRPALKKIFSPHNQLLRFLLLLTAIVVARVLRLADELEYGILIWPVFILLFALVIKELASTARPSSITRILIVTAFAAFLPNIVQLYFFEERDYEYKFAVGLNAGVMKQERERRILNEEMFQFAKKTLVSASDSLRDKHLHYALHIHYTDCDTCVVLTNVRELRMHQKTNRHSGSDLAKRRLVFAPNANLSRGWRNFVKDNYVPPITSKTLVLQTYFSAVVGPDIFR